MHPRDASLVSVSHMEWLSQRPIMALRLKSSHGGRLSATRWHTVSPTPTPAQVNMAKGAGWGVMASHRSGETEDSFIADLAVGLGTGQVRSAYCHARG